MKLYTLLLVAGFGLGFAVAGMVGEAHTELDTRLADHYRRGYWEVRERLNAANERWAKEHGRAVQKAAADQWTIQRLHERLSKD